MHRDTFCLTYKPRLQFCLLMIQFSLLKIQMFTFDTVEVGETELLTNENIPTSLYVTA